jgi:selenocysteine-specific elongation factor
VYVIGTAGHIDHGKSTLVKALTGIDPDRLREEKERGMTIDLGFAWLRLPSGREVSIVDVPGHERFIKNMLAGVGGIDLALLVIAADEGIMPQTEEHLAILELLQIKRAVVAMTKRDLVEDDWLELVVADVADRLNRSPIRHIPVVPVSAVTGEGLATLCATIDDALDDTPAKPNRGRPRLPIDRVFTISGFGTVVTGTLIDGALAVGQEVEIQPSGLRTRARGIQTHKHKVERAEPGSRVAVNLVGVPVESLERGQVLTTPGWLRPTSAIDARIQLVTSAPSIQHNATVSLHALAAETVAHVRLLDRDVAEPGAPAWAQIVSAAPIALTKGDLFVLRTPNATIGGGVVVDAHARRHRRSSAAVIDKLVALEQGEPIELVRQVIEARLGSDFASIVEQTGLSAADAKAIVDRLIREELAFPVGERYLGTGVFDELTASVVAALDTYHRRYPLRPGMPREELRSRLRLSARDAAGLLELLHRAGTIVVEESIARLPSHRTALTMEQEQRARRLVEELGAQPFAPPALEATMSAHDVDGELLAALVGRGEVAKISESIAFTSCALAEIRRRVVERIQQTGSINVAELRDLLDTSRKYALALLEYFDQQRVTRRVGDARVLR